MRLPQLACGGSPASSATPFSDPLPGPGLMGPPRRHRLLPLVNSRLGTADLGFGTPAVWQSLQSTGSGL